jgi:hypothetical protein
MDSILSGIPTNFKVEVSIDRNSMVYIAVVLAVTVAGLKFLK